jgi:hypothetical protein
MLTMLLFCSACECDHAACFDSPTPVERLEIRDKNNGVLWRLTGDGKHTLEDLTWGVVPRGYTQTFPTRGAPRTLQVGEHVLLLWKSQGYFTRHWGVAARPDVIHYGQWLSEPTADRADSQLFIDEPRTIDPEKGYPRDLPLSKRGG